MALEHRCLSTVPAAQGSLACQQHTTRPLGSTSSMAPACLSLQLLAAQMGISSFDTEPVTLTPPVEEVYLETRQHGQTVPVHQVQPADNQEHLQ